MRLHHGKLVGHDVVVVSFEDYLAHIRTYGEVSLLPSYCVGHDHIGDVMVSTMFLHGIDLHGIDHSFGGSPLWFESMTLGLRENHPIRRKFTTLFLLARTRSRGEDRGVWRCRLSARLQEVEPASGLHLRKGSEMKHYVGLNEPWFRVPASWCAALGFLGFSLWHVDDE